MDMSPLRNHDLGAFSAQKNTKNGSFVTHLTLLFFSTTCHAESRCSKGPHPWCFSRILGHQIDNY